MNRLLLACVLAAGCGASDPTADVVKQYAVMMHANMADVVTTLGALQDAIYAFTDAPSADGLAACQQAWLDSRPSYGEMEIARFYSGPIEDVQGRVNEWPIDEAFIDYTAVDPTGGIINDPAHYPMLTPPILASSDEKGGIENLSTGYHAIEYLLWGQRPDQTSGPGTRPYTDYVDGGTAANQARRRTYLRSAIELLVSDLTSVQAQWDLTDPGSYGSQMIKKPPQDELQLIIRGFSQMAISELYYERMYDPYITQNRKDEESCFSESTQVDLAANALGVENVYLGRYHAVAGKGVADLVAAKNPGLDAQLRATLSAIRSTIDAIPPPFDHSVIAPDGSDARNAVQNALDQFTPLQDQMHQLADLLGVTVNL
jgi:putative iron-regulated protein